GVRVRVRRRRDGAHGGAPRVVRGALRGPVRRRHRVAPARRGADARAGRGRCPRRGGRRPRAPRGHARRAVGSRSGARSGRGARAPQRTGRTDGRRTGQAHDRGRVPGDPRPGRARRRRAPAGRRPRHGARAGGADQLRHPDVHARRAVRRLPRRLGAPRVAVPRAGGRRRARAPRRALPGRQGDAAVPARRARAGRRRAGRRRASRRPPGRRGRLTDRGPGGVPRATPAGLRSEPGARPGRMDPMTTPDPAQTGTPGQTDAVGQAEEPLALADSADDEARERALRAGLEDYELEETDLVLLDADGEPVEGYEPEAPLPVLAVVGRPNVGKSTLVNRILGRREAVVEDKPGVTRDRVSYPAEWAGRRFTLVDTGGWEVDVAGIESKVADQAEVAISLADAVLFVVDATVGATATDERVVRLLRES